MVMSRGCQRETSSGRLFRHYIRKKQNSSSRELLKREDRSSCHSTRRSTWRLTKTTWMSSSNMTSRQSREVVKSLAQYWSRGSITPRSKLTRQYQTLSSMPNSRRLTIWMQTGLMKTELCKHLQVWWMSNFGMIDWTQHKKPHTKEVLTLSSHKCQDKSIPMVTSSSQLMEVMMMVNSKNLRTKTTRLKSTIEKIKFKVKV